MDDTHPATAATRLAVEFLTLWLESDRQGAAQHIERVVSDPSGPAVHSIIAGQCNLGMFLVLMLAKERGAGADNIMETAHGILRDLSRDLPE
jgi:hypothetical protein